MAKVLFINPVVREKDAPRHVPYGLALLVSLAIQKGHLVQVYDANAWRLGDDALRDVIESDDWDVIATGGISTTYGYVKKVCQFVREYSPNSLLVLGGGILTSLPREIMEFLPEAHIGVVGEAFLTFNEILAQVDAKDLRPEKILGVVYRTENGQIDLTAARPLLQDLDSLPYPSYDFFPLDEVYFNNSQVLFSEEGMMASRRLDVNASYGCSLVCKFCFHLGIAGDMKYSQNKKGERDVIFDAPGSYTRTIRYHSPRYIVDMVSYPRKKYEIDFVGFLDENLMTMDAYSQRTWKKEICDRWLEAGIQPKCIKENAEYDQSCKGIHWSRTSHATLCTREILKKMRQTGCSHLVYGYESFSPQKLKRLGKGATPQTNFRSFFGHWKPASGRFRTRSSVSPQKILIPSGSK